MTYEALLKKIDEALCRMKTLEREKNEAMARIQSLEREISEMRSILSIAESKVEEMLKSSTAPESAKGPSSDISLTSKGFEQLVESASSRQEGLRRRFPHAFTST